MRCWLRNCRAMVPWSPGTPGKDQGYEGQAGCRADGGGLPRLGSGSGRAQQEHACSPLLSCSMKRAASLNYLHKSSDASFEVSTLCVAGLEQEGV